MCPAVISDNLGYFSFMSLILGSTAEVSLTDITYDT